MEFPEILAYDSLNIIQTIPIAAGNTTLPGNFE
jgi:hypothetical protein